MLRSTQPRAVDTVNLAHAHEHAIPGCGRHILADVCRPQWQLAVAAIDERQDLHRRRTAAVDQRVQRGANRATGEEHVVDHDHHRAVNALRGAAIDIGERRLWGGGTRPVVAVPARVEHEDRGRVMAELGEPMAGLEIAALGEEGKLQGRGW